jgi:hypothetical protein
LAFKLDAQVLVQDSKGSSTVLYHGCTVGFDLSEAALGFSYNNNTNRRTEDHHFIWGVQFSAKNKDGTANLLATGKFSPETKETVTFGYTFSNVSSSEYEKLSLAIGSLYRDIEGLDRELQQTAKTSFEGYLVTIRNIKDSDKLEAELRDVLTQKDFRDLSASVASLIIKYQDFKNGLLILSEELSVRFGPALHTKQEKVTALAHLENEQTNYRSTHRYVRAALFINLGLSTNSFKYYDGTSTADLESRFHDTYHKGALANLGMNLQWGGRYIFGLSGGINRINNLDSLTKKDFALQTIEIVGSRELIEEKKITAYAGTYGTLIQYTLNADIVRFHKFGLREVLVSHLYVRHKISGNHNLVPTQTDVGLGAYFFKNSGTFLGGLYLEAPDIANNIEKQKPVPEPRPFYNRLKFGIIAKFSFGSIFTF